jgi:hypothetical protein
VVGVPGRHKLAVGAALKLPLVEAPHTPVVASALVVHGALLPVFWPRQFQVQVPVG